MNRSFYSSCSCYCNIKNNRQLRLYQQKQISYTTKSRRPVNVAAVTTTNTSLAQQILFQQYHSHIPSRNSSIVRQYQSCSTIATVLCNYSRRRNHNQHQHQQHQHQLQQQKRWTGSYFEDHIDAMKPLIEIPKMIDDADKIESFFMIEVEDDFIDILHGILCDFKSQFEEACRPSEYVRHSNEWGQMIPLDIQPYPKEEFRSILLFHFHETLCQLPPHQLIKFHRNLTQRLNTCGFLSQTSTSQHDEATTTNTCTQTNIEPLTSTLPPGQPTYHWYIRLKGFKLIPRDKLNTIAAVFQPSPFWRHLHKQIQQLANRTTGLQRTMTIDQCNEWEPSIPIAHVYNGMAGRTKYETMLRELIPIMPFHKFNVSSKIQRIQMYGTIPTSVPIIPSDLDSSPTATQQQQQQQQQLQWDFQFHGRPLLQIKERTDIQDSLPENFFYTSYNDNEKSKVKHFGYGVSGTNESNNNYDSDDDYFPCDNITDDELIEDPLENYVIALDDLDFVPASPIDQREKTYPDIDALSALGVDELNRLAAITDTADDEEINTDHVMNMNDPSGEDDDNELDNNNYNKSISGYSEELDSDTDCIVMRTENIFENDPQRE